MSDSTQNTSTPQPDALGRLYRMSKTAGLGSSEYKAVNVASVLSFVLGLASYVASFEPMLLVVPAVGLVLGIVALYQILDSNGTQTGKPLAVGGIVLSLAFGAWAGTASYRDAARTAADRAAISGVIAQLSEAVRAEKYDQALALFSDDFRSRIKLETFSEPWRYFHERRPLKDLRTNGLYSFDVHPETGVRIASGQLILEFTDGQAAADRPQIVLYNRTGKWEIEGIPAYYPIGREAPGSMVPTGN